MPLRAFDGTAPVVGERVYIDQSAVVIGAVNLEDDVSVWPFVVARADVNRIDVGARTNIQDATVLHVTHDSLHAPGGIALSIGEDVTVGHRALLHACTIGDRCLIGMAAVVMDGAVLGEDILLAAGALVPPRQQLEARSLYRGSPARRVRGLNARELAMLSYSAAHYVQLKDRYLKEDAFPP